MIKKHMKTKCKEKNYSELFQTEKNRHDSEYIYDDVITAEDVEHDSDSDILDPYPCMECGQKFDEYEDFHDHLKEVHKFGW